MGLPLKRDGKQGKAYIPGSEATVIINEVPPGRGLIIALRSGLTLAIIQDVDNSKVWGLGSRRSLANSKLN